MTFVMNGRKKVKGVDLIFVSRISNYKQVAQWATITHLGASIIFRDTIIDDAQKQVTLNLKQ